jgi:GT2 family glycosyltransferase
LRSVRDAVQTGWAEAIAVDSASPDESVSVLLRELPEAELLTRGQNRGFAAGANAALARASGRYWLLLNPDVEVPRDGLKAMVNWMDRHPSVGLASPNLVGADGEWQSPGRAMPSITRTALELTRLHRALPRHIRGRLLRGPYWSGGDQLDAGWVPGTAMIVRPAAARQVGRLREDLFMYGEDLEWCWRMRREGWRVGVCSATTFVHHTGASAFVTFGREETQRRIAAGCYAAHRVMYGPVRARALAATTALSLWLESFGLRRAPPARADARQAARTWQQLAAHDRLADTIARGP